MSQRHSWHFVVALALCSLSTGCGGDDGGGGGGGGAASIDACAIVTQADATALFGAEAGTFTSSGPATPIPGMRGECLWDYDYPDYSSQLLQFRVWDKEYYSEPTGAEAFSIGEQGYVAKGPFESVDVGWVQGEIAGDLSYSTTGPSAPDASLKKEQVKALATAAAGKLPK